MEGERRILVLSTNSVKVGIASEVSKDDIRVKPGLFPLLIFSHGFQSIAIQSLGLMEHLASHGFVVVSISHTGNVQDDTSSENPLADRYPDVVATINMLEWMNHSPTHRLHKVLDTQNVGVLGHSFGGLTVQLMAAGFGNTLRIRASKRSCPSRPPASQ